MSVPNFILSALLVLIIMFSLMQNALFLTIVAAGILSWKYSSYPLLVVAILVDSYFGSFYSFPVYSVLAILWVTGVELIRPRLFVVQS